MIRAPRLRGAWLHDQRLLIIVPDSRDRLLSRELHHPADEIVTANSRPKIGQRPVLVGEEAPVVLRCIDELNEVDDKRGGHVEITEPILCDSLKYRTLSSAEIVDDARSFQQVLPFFR